MSKSSPAMFAGSLSPEREGRLPTTAGLQTDREAELGIASRWGCREASGGAAGGREGEIYKGGEREAVLESSERKGFAGGDEIGRAHV